MEKHDFMIKYILARAGCVSDGIDIKLVIDNAEFAWNEIQKRK